MKFFSYALFALLVALSNSAYAVTAEECLDSYYQALEEYFGQPGVAENNAARCSKETDSISLSNGAKDSCEAGNRNSTRIYIRISKHKDGIAPLNCNFFYQACDDTSDTFYSEPLDSRGDAGKARGQISRLCDYLVE